MKISKFMGIAITFSFLLNSTAFANEIPIIPIDLIESNETQILNLELDGYEKTYNEAENSYTFTLENSQEQTNYSLEEPKLSITDFGIESQQLLSEMNYTTEAALSSSIDNDNSDIQLFASLPDLTISSISAPTTLYALASDSRINFTIANIGSASATNVQLGVKLDNNLVGTISMGTIEKGYGYNSYVSFGGVPTGSHTVELIADINNKISESNETNNNIKRAFVWVQNASQLPDLSVDIKSPVSNTQIKGPAKDTDAQKFSFVIRNSGAAIPSGTINCGILVNGVQYEQFSINALKSGASVSGSVDISLATYGNTTVSFRVDGDNKIQESNENNNMATGQYTVYYCTNYEAGVNPKRAKSKDLIVRIDPSVFEGNITEDCFSQSLGVWNNISDNCSITKAYMTATSRGDEDIIIKGVPNLYSSDGREILGNCGRSSKTSIITLNKSKLGKSSTTQVMRTLRHELGHSYGLGHPPCEYKALMKQSIDSPLYINTPTPHDCYNLYNYYKN